MGEDTDPQLWGFGDTDLGSLGTLLWGREWQLGAGITYLVFPFSVEEDEVVHPTLRGVLSCFSLRIKEIKLLCSVLLLEMQPGLGWSV